MLMCKETKALKALQEKHDTSEVESKNSTNEEISPMLGSLSR